MPRYRVHVERIVTETHYRTDTAEIEVEADSDSRRDIGQAISDYEDNHSIPWDFGDSTFADDLVDDGAQLDDNYDIECLDCDEEPPEDDDSEPREDPEEEPSEVEKLLEIASLSE